MMTFEFNATGDYKAQLNGYIDTIYGLTFESPAQRVEVADALTESYFMATGKVPDVVPLDRLSTFILLDTLKSKDQTKKNQENAILSETQFENRYRKERSDKYGENYGVDGKNYNPPTRQREKYQSKLKFK